MEVPLVVVTVVVAVTVVVQVLVAEVEVVVTLEVSVTVVRTPVKGADTSMLVPRAVISLKVYDELAEKPSG